jgi:hypothetical protein
VVSLEKNGAQALRERINQQIDNALGGGAPIDIVTEKNDRGLSFGARPIVVLDETHQPLEKIGAPVNVSDCIKADTVRCIGVCQFACLDVQGRLLQLFFGAAVLSRKRLWQGGTSALWHSFAAFLTQSSFGGRLLREIASWRECFTSIGILKSPCSHMFFAARIVS